jgi:hypothetical protein
VEPGTAAIKPVPDPPEARILQLATAGSVPDEIAHVVLSVPVIATLFEPVAVATNTFDPPYAMAAQVPVSDADGMTIPLTDVRTVPLETAFWTDAKPDWLDAVIPNEALRVGEYAHPIGIGLMPVETVAPKVPFETVYAPPAVVMPTQIEPTDPIVETAAGAVLVVHAAPVVLD